ncbi:MAG: response regulator [Candidatus Eisenbacteria sp.]|nr:response regulator [Candidatus Eisenbacteria bacterium]
MKRDKALIKLRSIRLPTLLRDKLLAAVLGFLAPGLAAMILLGSLLWQADEASGALARSPLSIVLAGVVVVGMLGASAILLISRRALRSLDQLLRAARAVAAGQHEPPVSIGGDAEIVAFGQAVHAIADRMESSRMELEEENRRLEETIQLKTEEVTQKNLALAFQNEKLKELDQLKSAFLASVSHELRTPLNAILALSEMLRDKVAGPMNNEQIKQASMILSSGENLLNLINKVLDLSKIEAGRMELRKKKIKVVDELVTACQGLRPLAEEKDLDFRIEAEGEGVEAYLDIEKLRQVLINLVGNAIKFTQSGSVTAQIRMLREKDLLQVEIRDTGPGIPPECQSHIFQEFRQVHDERLLSQKGTGLGLAISKKLIDLMGGEIWVESVIDEGSRFSFLTPLGIQAGAREVGDDVRDEGIGSMRDVEFAQRVTHRRESCTSQACILIVDSDIVEAGVMGRYLRRLGFTVLTALDGQEAITILRHGRVNLVLLDLRSESGDGIRLLRRVERNPDLRTLPVIVSMDREPAEDEAAILSSLVHTIFTKREHKVQDLLDLISSILEEPTAAGGPEMPEKRSAVPGGGLGNAA